jgi:hypothetical protein
MKVQDVTIHFPAEYLDILPEIITRGIKKAKISPKVKQDLQAWWEAEYEFINWTSKETQK